MQTNFLYLIFVCFYVTNKAKKLYGDISTGLLENVLKGWKTKLF